MIRFESTSVQSTFLDPNDDYAPRSLTIEHRRDPLTGRYSRITDYLPAREPTELGQDVVDAVIPIFKPPLVEQITPRFPKEIDGDGRLKRGRSILFPNLNPYDEYSPVAAIGDRDLVRPGELSPEDVGDAFCLMRDFFAALPEDRRLGLVGWNYLPPSSSSIPHPHLQAVANARVPERMAAEYAAERSHRDGNGTDFWDDLIAAERDGARWLGGSDGWSRMMAFAPKSPIPEALIVADDVADLRAASDDHLHALAGQIITLANAYHAAGYSAFNIALHPTSPVDASRLRARYIPRTYIVPKISSSDVTWLHLGTDEGLCLINPERFAEELRPHL